MRQGIGFMPLAQRIARRLLGPVLVTTALLGLPGCGGLDGVEFNGKLFEAVGLTGALGAKREEPRTEPRAPLVLPPASERLPAPGELAAAPQQPDAAWPNDPDKRKAAAAAAKKQAQAERCGDGAWKEKAMKDELAMAKVQDDCGSIFSVMSKTLFGE